MSFWGIEVKPGKPYTHSSQNGSTRLRISQATLANGSATLKSLVQCNVGDKQPVYTSLDTMLVTIDNQIYKMNHEAMFLFLHYGGKRESYGEDIANSETQESNHNSDEDEYEDSFINDDEPEPLTPSPISSSREDDDGDCLKKKGNGNGGRKRLKKKYKSIESDDEMSVPEIEDEDDFPISSICKNNKSQVSEEKTDKETKGELDRVTKNNDMLKLDGVHSGILDSKDKVNVHLIDDKAKEKGDQTNMSVPSLAKVVPEGRSKPKKKKQESTKEERATGPSSVDHPSVQVSLTEVKTKKKKKENTKKGNADKADDEGHAGPLEDNMHQCKVESNSINHDVLAAKDDKKPNDMGVDRSFEVLASAEVVPEKNSKLKKKRQGRSEVSTDGTDGNLLAGNKQEDDQQAIDKGSGIDSKQLPNGIQSEEKRVKKKRRKTSKTQEVEENINMEVEKENEPSATQPEGKDKESESCDKEVMVGLNVGVDGMRVGDKRRLIIPPSMSSGYKGTGENVPPNSWLVYDVEVTSIH
ncbi:Peptidyl-prolyl cis-trans isomerase, FKBP-type, partial [Cynara cardunculus var. scolymus]